MNEREAIDEFGKVLMNDLRDKSIDFFELLVGRKWKSPSLQKLQTDLQSFNEEQIEIIRRILIRSVDSGIHDFLFKLQDQADFDNEIEITIQGVNIISASDGLHGELFTEDGWYVKFSKYGENNKEDY
ncbi:hypothetical protein [Paenibacillus gallinarum]|uniref:Uncharacterized protein n=1 Tax=Paenibacillus gallinarum TaxID=2762232 RepID=A0ABR8ST24_9BACL|nr:hypothetical protein [Paenibacillus gallinarum]MBD7966648.1 hypothetical protein [Paenibacillus gallinarum]